MPRLAGAARRARLRDRRRRGEGRRPRAAAAPRRRRARPALGGRLEVPADDRRHAAAPRALERRQVRRPAPVRRARAGPRRRRHGEDGDAAQRGGPRAQGRPRGRRRDRAARRRRDPAGRLARRRTRSSGPTARRPSARRSAARRATRRRSRTAGRVFTRCPNRDCPDRRWQLLKHWAGALDIDGLGEKQVRIAAGRRASCAPSPTTTGSSKEQLLELEGVGEVSAENLLRSIDGVARAAVRQRAVRRRDRGRRATSPAATSPSSSARSTRCSPRRPRRSRPRRGSARSWRS